MSAAELRQAAETLRERANGSAKGPWSAGRSGRVAQMMTPGLSIAVADCYPSGGSDAQARQAAYIATMHPGVGLALADLMERHANRCAVMRMEPGDEWTTLARLVSEGGS